MKGLATPWFPGRIKPVRKGWYEVRNNPPQHHLSCQVLRGRPFRYWTGYQWMTAAPNMSWSFVSIFGSHPSHEWRGLTARTPQAERTEGGGTP